MREFDSKKVASKYIYSVGFSDFLSDGVTISTADVSIAVYDKSSKSDEDADDMIVGSAQINAAAVTIDGSSQPIGSVILQAIAGGVQDCDYICSYSATLSDGQVICEDVLLRVRKYEPVIG